jgi:hypothetical protein
MQEQMGKKDVVRANLISLSMKRVHATIAVLFLLTVIVFPAVNCTRQHLKDKPDESGNPNAWDRTIRSHGDDLFEKGKRVFRYETFGDEVFWTDQLKLHSVIAGEKHGGIGEGLTPKAALAAGLKVDLDILPKILRDKIREGKFLDDVLVTMELIKLNAVLGVVGHFNGKGDLESIGLTCAVCHSTVDDDSGIGSRLDGWPNQDLNVGGIIAMAPDLSVLIKLLDSDEKTVRKVLASWGPGMFDAELNLDGKAFRPDGKSAATRIPPAYNTAGKNNHTWTGGWGTVTYWNAYVANLELQGQGVFYDKRLMDAAHYPVAAKAGFGNKRGTVDSVTNKLAALQYYQLAIPAPEAPARSYDKVAAGRGREVFNNKAQCNTCHVPPLFTEPGWNTHKPADIGIDAFQANRSPDSTYVTPSLKGLWSRSKRGFYHDGRFATMLDVVNHYNSFKKLGLTESEKTDLVEYLKSL